MSVPKVNKNAKKDFKGKPLKSDPAWQKMVRGGDPPGGVATVKNGKVIQLPLIKDK